MEIVILATALATVVSMAFLLAVMLVNQMLLFNPTTHVFAMLDFIKLPLEPVCHATTLVTNVPDQMQLIVTNVRLTVFFKQTVPVFVKLVDTWTVMVTVKHVTQFVECVLVLITTVVQVAIKLLY